MYVCILLIVISPIYATCGDSLCGNEESASVCPQDCQPEFKHYIQCFIDKDTCTSTGLYEFVMDIAILTFVFLVFVYLKAKRYV